MPRSNSAYSKSRLAPGKVKAAVGWATEPNLQLRFEQVLLSIPIRT